MKNQNYTGNLIGVNVSKHDRAAFLRKLPKSKKPRHRAIAPGVMASRIWGQDVSGSDSRSVKAQLTGRGDLRPFWWHLNCAIHRLLCHDASLEQAMYDFHRRHHALTLGWLEFVHDFAEAVRVTRLGGLQAGLDIMREQDRRKASRE